MIVPPISRDVRGPGGQGTTARIPVTRRRGLDSCHGQLSDRVPGRLSRDRKGDDRQIACPHDWSDDRRQSLDQRSDSAAGCERWRDRLPDAVWPQVAEVRGAVLDTISTFAPPGASFIFTLAGADEDPDDRWANGTEESSSIPSKRSPMSGPIVRWTRVCPGAHSRRDKSRRGRRRRNHPGSCQRRHASIK
jgi:hypothetical protein